jgi:hypothetical protein
LLALFIKGESKMKKVIEKETEFCDVCGKEETYPHKCLNCGKEICYKCAKTEGIEYKHSVWASGTGDGFYCNACDLKLKTTGDKLHTAYRKIVSLRNEQDGFYKDFRERAEKAEADVKKLQG